MKYLYYNFNDFVIIIYYCITVLIKYILIVKNTLVLYITAFMISDKQYKSLINNEAFNKINQII